MTGLEIALVTALVVTAWALPMGIWRTLAYRSGHITADHTRTMRIAATVALSLGLLGLVVSIALGAAILAS